MDFTDQPGPIRKGEELKTTGLEVFLKDTIGGLEGGLTVRQFPGGHSNLTYHLAVGKREMVLRRPPFGTKAKSAHDMGREYRVLSAIHPVYPYAPRPLVYTDDASIIGAPFYVMERINGVVLRRELPPGLTLSPDQARELIHNLIRALYQLHSLDYRQIGLENLGRPQGYVRRQVEGWNRRYRDARTPDAPDGEQVMAWLEENIPPDNERPGIIHNDFKLNNLIVDQHDLSRIVGVFDWEMATLGDPVLDLIGSLAYVIEPDDPPEMETNNQWPLCMRVGVTRKELLNLYEELSGRTIHNFDYYHCLSHFRLAVIIQQIYYRYHHGQTQDERFAPMILAVHALVNFAGQIMERSG